MLETLILAIIAAGQPADGEIQSGYTRLENCVETEGPAPINEMCEGYGGWTVFIGASDHSAGLAFSERARDEQMMQRPLTEGLFQSFSPSLEWRVRWVEGAWVPFAAIHRWTSSTPVYDEAVGDFTGEVETGEHVLVIAALRGAGPIGACHIAYVDVAEVYDANTVARAIADLDADLFQCGVDEPVRVGAGEAVRVMARAGIPY